MAERKITDSQQTESLDSIFVNDGGNLRQIPKEKAREALGITDAESNIDDLKGEIANLNGGAYSNVEPDYTDIPKVFFDEAIPQSKTDVVTKFTYISKSQNISGYAKFKAQGNSSMNYAKKNVTVKMYEDEACENKLKVDFKGWGKQSKHVYKANWIDLTHARNIVSARLWGASC